MTVDLAHMTDPHLPLAGVALRELLGKRILGWLSWTLRRHRAHRPDVLTALLHDICLHAPHAHLIITGDLVNVSGRAEFDAARRWLERLATARDITIVPGNHDFYVADAARAGLPSLRPWMGAPAATGGKSSSPAPTNAGLSFPFVRYLGNVALIGLNSAHPAPWREASGRLGVEQLQRLENLLRKCRTGGFCRVVLIHHPPLPSLNTKPRKALKDARALEEVLCRAGAELVLFGHVHRWQRKEIVLPGGGRLHLLSVPSASMTTGRKRPPAGWQLIRIDRRQGEWRIEVARRELQPDGNFRQRETFTLSCPT